MVLTTQKLKAAISDARLSVQEARAALLGANKPATTRRILGRVLTDWGLRRGDRLCLLEVRTAVRTKLSKKPEK
jgi:hypothetical protein